MKIHLIEPDHSQSASLSAKLRQQFVDVEVVEMANAREFLILLATQSKFPDLVITEQRLPLIAPHEDALSHITDLENYFPRVRSWDHTKAGEIIAQTVGETVGDFSRVPIIIYSTKGFYDGIKDGSVCEVNPNAVYCEKLIKFDNLIAIINAMQVFQI